MPWLVLRPISRYEEALSICRESEDWKGICVAASNLAHLSILGGLLGKGQELTAEALEVARRAGSVTWQLSGVGCLSHLGLAEGRIDEALALLGLAWHHPAQSVDGRQDLEEFVLPRLEETLSPEEIQAGMEKGKDLDLDDVVEAFLAGAT